MAKHSSKYDSKLDSSFGIKPSTSRSSSNHQSNPNNSFVSSSSALSGWRVTPDTSGRSIHMPSSLSDGRSNTPNHDNSKPNTSQASIPYEHNKSMFSMSSNIPDRSSDRLTWSPTSFTVNPDNMHNLNQTDKQYPLTHPPSSSKHVNTSQEFKYEARKLMADSKPLVTSSLHQSTYSPSFDNTRSNSQSFNKGIVGLAGSHDAEV